MALNFWQAIGEHVWDLLFMLEIRQMSQGPTIFRLISAIVKLHSDLGILTQLQLVGVGVDFVFPKEGRNPHLAFSRRNDPTSLIFSDCLVGV